MELYQYSDRIYYSAFEEERDRPALGYIKGNRFSIAIDAGHSDSHLYEFYDELKKFNLPLPSLTIITHWHWDHSFAMHAINGLSIVNEKTDRHLKDFIAKQNPESEKEFLNLDPSIRKEYADNKPIKVVLGDIVFNKELQIDAGDIKVKAMEVVSPHTDDATFILVPEERVLFFGDATSGVFPSWIADPVLLKQIIETIASLDVDYCIGGHWPIYKKADLLDQLNHSL